jgi:hypothetical protein
MFTDLQVPVMQGRGWGRGEARRRESLLLPPPPYPAVHFTVHLYSSRTLFRTVGEYRLSAVLIAVSLSARSQYSFSEFF